MPKRRKLKRSNKNKKESTKFSFSLIIGLIFVILVPIVSYVAGYKNASKQLLVKPETSRETSLAIVTIEPLPTEIPNDNHSLLVETIIKYYDYISTRQFNRAYALLSQNFQKTVGGFENFSKGFATTVNVQLLDAKVDNSQPNAVYIKIIANDANGTKTTAKTYSGIVKMVFEDNAWKINGAALEQI